MAARDRMDHAVAKPFADRVANLNAERAAENLAQGDASFRQALDQWIGSYGHRQNLLMHEGDRALASPAPEARAARSIGRW